MKKLILAVISIFAFIGLANAQDGKGVNWEKSTFSEVLKKAQNDPQGRNLVFLDCYASWCGPCRYMATKVFTTEKAGKYFNSTFINMKQDMEKGEGPDMAQTYNIRVYPTFLILNAQGKELARIEGGNEVDAFIETIDSYVQKIKAK